MTENVETHDSAHTVVVSVANPATAAALIELATMLVDPDDGRILVLTINLGNTEQQAEIEAQLDPMIERHVANGVAIELIAHVSAGVARGILDVSREKGADLIILGLQPRPDGAVVGIIAQNVAATAPCDVVIFRDTDSSIVKRIVVPSDGSDDARVASRIGILLAQRYQTPVEAIYVQDNSRPSWEGLARIEHTIDGLAGSSVVKRTVVTATNPVSGILARVSEHDMLILGFPKRSTLDKWLYGEVVRPILDRAPGPVLLASRAVHTDNRVAQRLRRWIDWVRPVLTTSEQDGIVWSAEEMAAPSLDFFVLIVLSALLASLGLLLNSPAVIIGAMLVAPLMQPLIGFGVGLTDGRASLSWRALVTLGEGVLLGIGVALIAGRLIPPNAPTAEMLARSSPSVLDAYVAFGSGLIGAYATARKDIPSALAGVAIAAALMPPLCTVGLGFTLGDTQLGLGALLLFFTNIVCISLASAAVFLWLGIRPRLQNSVHPWRYLVIVAATLATVPLVALLLSFSRGLDQSALINQSLLDSFAPASVVTVAIEDDGPRLLRVIATLRTSNEISGQDVDQAERALSDTLKRPVDLGVVVLRVVRPMQVTPETPSDQQVMTPTPETETLPAATAVVTPG